MATRSRRIDRNPLDGLDPPKTAAQEMSFLSHEEVAAIADAIDERYRAFVLVAAYCGLRAGELRGLRRRDVDLLRRTIVVTQQLVDARGGGFDVRALKTKKSRRSVAIPPHVAKVLASHLDECEFAQRGADGLVFTSALGDRLRPLGGGELSEHQSHRAAVKPGARPRNEERTYDEIIRSIAASDPDLA